MSNGGPQSYLGYTKDCGLDYFIHSYEISNTLIIPTVWMRTWRHHEIKLFAHLLWLLSGRWGSEPQGCGSRIAALNPNTLLPLMTSVSSTSHHSPLDLTSRPVHPDVCECTCRVMGKFHKGENGEMNLSPQCVWTSVSLCFKFQSMSVNMLWRGAGPPGRPPCLCTQKCPAACVCPRTLVCTHAILWVPARDRLGQNSALK